MLGSGRRGSQAGQRLLRGLLDLLHYSDEPREVIDPQKHLTNKNIRGAERDLNYPTRMTPFREEPEVIYQPYPAQSYWGDENYIPEPGLGDYVHTSRQPEEGFYDVSEDMDKFYMIAREEIMDMAKTHGKQLSPQEIHRLATGRAMGIAKEQGYLGLSNRKFRPNVYTQFEAVVPDLIEYLGKVDNE